LCDIGVFNSLPTTVTRTYATKCLVAVDVSARLKQLSRCDTAVDVLMRMDEIGESHFRKHVCATADLVINPDVSDMAWFDFSSSRQLIEAGREAARQAVPSLTAACCGS
ncbi:MAG: patatin-like phospholipase family protein, partial [Planctomycetes bacterium]|nr:patatin-like phospholipase family protein [Planctomycetota bacterium]